MKLSQVAARFADLFVALPASRCAAMIGSAAVLAFAPAAHAVVVVSPVANVLIPLTVAGLYINVVSGVVSPTRPGAPGYDINPWGTGALFVYGAAGGGVVTSAADNGVASLPIGTSVGSSSSFSTDPFGATAASGWALNSTNYIGFSFTGDDALLHYGYASVIVGGTFTTPTRSIGQIWYESAANTAITISAVPEPATWAMMACGLAAAGALARRRRQTQA